MNLTHLTRILILPAIFLMLSLGVLSTHASVLPHVNPIWNVQNVVCDPGSCVIRVGMDRTLYILNADISTLYIVKDDGSAPFQRDMSTVLVNQRSSVDILPIDDGRSLILYAYPETTLIRYNLEASSTETLSLPNGLRITTCDQPH